MNVDLGIWGKLTRVVIFLFALAGVLLVAVWFLPLIRTNERMRQEVLRLETLKQKQEETNRQLKAALDAQHNDPKAVERLVRERLGYARPDEIIVRFEEPPTNPLVAH